VSRRGFLGDLLSILRSRTDHLLTDRVNAFGFLAGAQVKEAGVGNIGLQDRKYTGPPPRLR
jgi:hypothetical protein